MLFACIIENTDISIGLLDRDRLVYSARLATDVRRTADEYALIISGLMTRQELDLSQINGAIIASVVRPLGPVLSQALASLFQTSPLILGPGIKSGLSIRTDIPSQVGADIVANAVGALERYPGPLLVLDFGTASTLAAVNENKELCGVIICPGIRSSLDALSQNAAELPRLDLQAPRRLLGKNTLEAMASGIIYGHAAMIDGLLDRIKAEWNNELTIIATGRYAAQVVPFCQRQAGINLDQQLAFSGLNRIFALNQPKK